MALLVSRALLTLAQAVAVVLILVRPFLFWVYGVPSASMSPSLRVGDRVVASPIPYRFTPPRVGEIAVFRTGGALHRRGIDRTKRIVAGPGEAIRIEAEDDGARHRLYVDGQPVREPYVHQVMAYELTADAADAPPGFQPRGRDLKVPTGQYVLLGDNRNVSVDSHVFGPVHRDQIRAKVLAVYWPPQRARLITGQPREVDAP